MKCQQSFFRLAILRPTRDDEATAKYGVSGFWSHHESFNLDDDSSPLFSGFSGTHQPTGLGVVTDFPGLQASYAVRGAFVGPAGYPSAAYLAFRKNAASGVYCTSSANALVVNTFALGKAHIDNVVVPVFTSGVVTVKAFFYDPNNPNQESNGVFVRLTSSVSDYAVDLPPAAVWPNGLVDTAGRYSFVQPRKWSLATEWSYPNAWSQPRPDMLYASQRGYVSVTSLPRTAVFQQQPMTRHYMRAIQHIEFGKIDNGQLLPQSSSYSAVPQNQRLILGCNRRSAFAGYGNLTYGRVYFPTIIINPDLLQDADGHESVNYFEKHPLRFKVESTPGSSSLVYQLFDIGIFAPSQMIAQATVQCPAIPVLVSQGCQVDDIRGTVAAKTLSSMQSDQADHMHYTYGYATSVRAKYRAAEDSFFPASQPFTDAALAIGSPKQLDGLSATIVLTCIADATSNSSETESISAWIDLFQRGQTTNYNSLGWPSWLDFNDFFETPLALPLNYQPSTPYSAVDLPRFNKAGSFGSQTFLLRQNLPENKTTVGEWYGRQAGESTIQPIAVGLVSQSRSKKGTVTTAALWAEWNQQPYDKDLNGTAWDKLQEEFSSDLIPIQGMSASPWIPFTNASTIAVYQSIGITLQGQEYVLWYRYHMVDETGIPPGKDINGVPYTTRWSQLQQEFTTKTQSTWNAVCDDIETVSVEYKPQVHSLEAKGVFTLSAEFENTSIQTDEWPKWARLYSDAPAKLAAGNNDRIMTRPSKPSFDAQTHINIKDEYSLQAYAAAPSYQTKAEFYKGQPAVFINSKGEVRDELYDPEHTLRKTPNRKGLSLTCTVTLNQSTKGSPKKFELFRRMAIPNATNIENSGLLYQQVVMDHDTNEFQVMYQSQSIASSLAVAGLSGVSIEWQ